MTTNEPFRFVVDWCENVIGAISNVFGTSTPQIEFGSVTDELRTPDEMEVVQRDEPMEMSANPVQTNDAYMTDDEDESSSAAERKSQRAGSITTQQSYKTARGGDTGSVEEELVDEFSRKGCLQLEIENFRSFAAQNIDLVHIESDSVFIRGMRWKILVKIHEAGTAVKAKYLSIHLQCDADGKASRWDCDVRGRIVIYSQCEGIAHHQKGFEQLNFNNSVSEQGFNSFIAIDTLLDETKGFIKDDKIRIEANVYAGDLKNLDKDSDLYVGYAGLRNQGATCYMNSILQAMFFTNKLRKAVYQMPIEGKNEQFLTALQYLFYQLQFSKQSVSTHELTRTFDWSFFNSYTQHDVQEFCRLIFDKIETAMKDTLVDGTISSLLKGQSRTFIRCTGVDFKSSRDEYFYDLQLRVQGMKNVRESFEDYTRLELLNGDNEYDAEGHGKQEAEKGIQFLKLSPVLHLHLMRFHFDYDSKMTRKLNDRYEFPEELDLNGFVDKSENVDDYTYRLQAVLVHSGCTGGGHYVVYINPKLEDGKTCWCRFDDSTVARCSAKEAISDNFGGGTSSWRNAYMLVYVQKNKIGDVLCKVTKDDIPKESYEKFKLYAERIFP